MKPFCLAPQTVALALSFTLALPNPALAMRVESAQQSAGAEELRDALVPAGAEEQELLKLLPSPVGLLRPAAGAEERDIAQRFVSDPVGLARWLSTKASPKELETELPMTEAFLDRPEVRKALPRNKLAEARTLLDDFYQAQEWPEEAFPRTGRPLSEGYARWLRRHRNFVSKLPDKLRTNWQYLRPLRELVGEDRWPAVLRGVLRNLRTVPRHLFVPRFMSPKAFWDQALPVGYGQTLSQPSLMALLLTVLDLKKSDKVLEIGAGTGWLASVISRRAKHVTATERIRFLADRAKRNVRKLGLPNVAVVYTKQVGYARSAPYDVIVVSAGTRDIPPALIDQLAPGGRMIIPLYDPKQSRKHREELYALHLYTKNGNQLQDRGVLIHTRFVPLIPPGSPSGPAAGAEERMRAQRIRSPTGSVWLNGSEGNQLVKQLLRIGQPPFIVLVDPTGAQGASQPLLAELKIERDKLFARLPGNPDWRWFRTRPEDFFLVNTNEEVSFYRVSGASETQKQELLRIRDAAHRVTAKKLWPNSGNLERANENLLVDEAVVLIMKRIESGQVDTVRWGSLILLTGADLTAQKIASAARRAGRKGWLQVQFQDRTAQLVYPILSAGAEEAGVKLSGRGAETGADPRASQWKSSPRPPSSLRVLPEGSFQSPLGKIHTLHNNSITSANPAANLSHQKTGLINSPDNNAAGSRSLNTSMAERAINSRLLSEKNPVRMPDILHQNISIINNVPAAGAEEARAPTTVTIVIGPSAFEQVPGLRAAVQALQKAGLEERLILLPEEPLPEAELTDRLSGLATKLLSGRRPTLIGYATSFDKAMEEFRRMVAFPDIAFLRREPMGLKSFVLQILDDVGISAAGSEKAAEEILSAAGIGQAA